MGGHGGHRRREEGRHWLPSQGVDPAPLAELNSECLAQLVMRASSNDIVAPTPPLVSALRVQLASLSGLAARRLAAAPFTLFEVGLASAPRWRELRTRGVNDQPVRREPSFFEAEVARTIARRMLVYGWHLARSRPRAACLVFGATIATVESLAACSLSVLEAAADRNSDLLRPRWCFQVRFWRELLLAASADDDARLHELLLGGVQRLAAETLAATPP